MGTKNNPGAFDCYENAEPDEPMFILLGRDPTAWALVVLWAELRAELGKTEPAKIEEAQLCAAKMRAWAESKGKDVDATIEALIYSLKLKENAKKALNIE